jgi:hypothetical protein
MYTFQFYDRCRIAMTFPNNQSGNLLRYSAIVPPCQLEDDMAFVRRLCSRRRSTCNAYV